MITRRTLLGWTAGAAASATIGWQAESHIVTLQTRVSDQDRVCASALAKQMQLVFT